MMHKKFQQKKSILLYLNKAFCLLLALLFGAMLHCSAQDSIENYDDESDTLNNENIDTTTVSSGHIYDTSQNFFNWKEDVNIPYTNKKINTRVPADDEVNKLKNEDDFWYVKSIEKFKAHSELVTYQKAEKDSLAKAGKGDANTTQFTEEETETVLPQWAEYIIWGVIIAVFVFAVVYFLSVNKISIFSKKSAGSEANADAETVDLFKIPYTDMLQKAYAEKNYRLAVRILYLQTLKMLSEKNIITYQADFTNMHYLQQLSQTLFYKDFFTITRHYEYVWYGEFAVSESAFDRIKNDFSGIQNKVLQR